MAAAFSIEADFECSLDHLWSYVSHVPNQDHWVFGMSDSEVVGSGEIRVGSEIVGTSTEQGKALRVTMTVKEFDPPSRISWENTDGHTPFITVITCSGNQTSSRMSYHVTLYPTALLMKIVMGPLRPLGTIIANRMLRQEIVHLRRALGEQA
ncbi:MAG: SRPBCC family protein [Chloroflexota bacterium]|nr:SRPBCC family protein [Chloroflexota bacterium]MDE2896502.1 SRPBCC family protein [Chloroflexota bacterium]